MTIQILLADDHKITSDGLKALLENQKNMTVIGEAENGRKGLIELKQARDASIPYDLLLLDDNMPDMDGFQTRPPLQVYLRRGNYTR